MCVCTSRQRGKERGRNRLTAEQEARYRTQSQRIMTWAEGRCLTDCTTQASRYHSLSMEWWPYFFFFFFGKHTFGKLRNSFVQSRWCARCENNRWQVLWREASGLRENLCACFILGIVHLCDVLYPLSDVWKWRLGASVGDMLVHNKLVHNKWARETLSMLYLQTYSKRLVLGQPESCLFAVPILSFLRFLLVYWKEASLLFLEVFSLYLRFFFF